MKKRILALVLALAMVFALAACGGGGEQGGSTGTPAPETNTGTPSTDAPETSGGGAPTELKVAMTTTMGDMGPFTYSSAGRNNLRYFVYEYLAMFKEFGTPWNEMEWVIAKDIQQIDDVTYQIEIYDYVVDAIGNPITASDVAFCFNTMRDNGNWTRITRYLESCTAIEDYKVEIKVTSSLVGVLEYLMCQVPIVSEKTYTENESTMNTTPITTAAYHVTECVNGSYYTIEKNANYWQTDESLRSIYAQQPVEKMTYNIITEGNQATIALQMGEVDLITTVGTSELGYFINADGTVVDGYSAASSLSSQPVSLLFNMAEDSNGDIFRDNLALRQAICYGIDTQAICNIARGGFAEPCYDLTFPGCGDFNQEWLNEDYYNYDLEKAKALLEEAGYPGGKDPATGSALHIRLLCDQQRKDAAVVIQSQLMELGLEVELLALDDAMFSDYQYDPTQWDISIMKQGTEAYISNIYDGYMLRNKDGVGAKNFIVDDELEALLEAAHDVSTHSAETVDALHDYVKDNAIAYGLYVDQVYAVGREGIEVFQHPWNVLVPNACTFN